MIWMGLGERPSVCLKVTAHPYAMETHLGSGSQGSSDLLHYSPLYRSQLSVCGTQDGSLAKAIPTRMWPSNRTQFLWCSNELGGGPLKISFVL